MLLKKLSIALVISLSFYCSMINAYAAELFLGGDSIGIDLSYNGVLITGTYAIEVDGKAYDPSSDGFKEGHLITHVNGQRVESISELMKEIEKRVSVSQKIMLTYQDHQKTKTQQLYLQNKNDQFSTGLYVIDGISGIGTMTYYNPSTHHFAALGHMMCDTSLTIDIADVKGAIYQSKVTNIVKSQSRKPGEKIAEISHVQIGEVFDNNQYGLYGRYDASKVKDHQKIQTASMDEIKTGKAYFYTVLEGNKVGKYEINITNLKKQSTKDIKGITFEVTDQEVLEKCNGIVQGMSGSPIIQDGKLIGCVTHVDVNNTHKGYGLYIDWMLENDN